MVAILMATAPARETVQVACLPKNVNVEISLVAQRFKLLKNPFTYRRGSSPLFYMVNWNLFLLQKK